MMLSLFDVDRGRRTVEFSVVDLGPLSAAIYEVRRDLVNARFGDIRGLTESETEDGFCQSVAIQYDIVSCDGIGRFITDEDGPCSVNLIEASTRPLPRSRRSPPGRKRRRPTLQKHPTTT